jgi:hypothetical protein
VNSVGAGLAGVGFILLLLLSPLAFVFQTTIKIVEWLAANPIAGIPAIIVGVPLCIYAKMKYEESVWK